MLTRILIALCIILFTLNVGAYFYIGDLRHQVAERNNAISLLIQNERALQDQIEMKSDSLQIYAAYVKDLQKEIEKLSGEYNLLASKYSIAIDSIKVLNKPTPVDTSGNTIIITFAGKEGKVSYKGKTTYFKLTGEGTYSIDIGVDTTIITTRIYADSSGIIKNQVFADGNLITHAETNIDSSLYRLIQGAITEKPTPMGVFDRLKATFELNQTIINKSGIYSADQFDLNVGLEYQLGKNIEFYGKKRLLNNGYETGIRVKPSLKDIFKVLWE